MRLDAALRDDQRSDYDKKTVSGYCRNPGTWSWGTPQITYPVNGLEGGYRDWRTQLIDLEACRDQLVKVRFSFDSVDNQYNNHLGWLITNIGVGHDHDGDGLPDVVEDRRLDTHVARHSAAVRFSAEWKHGMIRSVDRIGAAIAGNVTQVCLNSFVATYRHILERGPTLTVPLQRPPHNLYCPPGVVETVAGGRA